MPSDQKERGHLLRKKEIVNLGKPQIPSPNPGRKIGGFLLAPEAIPVLEERIEKGDPVLNRKKYL